MSEGAEQQSVIRSLLAQPEKLAQIALYEDDICVAVLSTKPMSVCHVIVIPKRQVTIMEQLPEDELAHIFDISNTISQAMFETLNIQGTNILIQNGVPAGQNDAQFSINIVARSQEDGVTLDWQPQELTPEEMESAESSYTEVTKTSVLGHTQEEKVIEEPSVDDYSDDEEEENYLVKYFDRGGP